MITLATTPTVAALLLAVAPSDSAFIRVNQLGYAPDAPKVAVVCALQPVAIGAFELRDAGARVVLRGRAQASAPFAACTQTWRLDFTRLAREGTYRLEAGALAPVTVRIGRAACAFLDACGAGESVAHAAAAALAADASADLALLMSTLLGAGAFGALEFPTETEDTP